MFDALSSANVDYLSRGSVGCHVYVSGRFILQYVSHCTAYHSYIKTWGTVTVSRESWDQMVNDANIFTVAKLDSLTNLVIYVSKTLFKSKMMK